MRKFTKFTAFLAAVLVLTMGGVAMAATDTATFGVSATVDAACVVGTTSPMAFSTLAATILDASTGQISSGVNNDKTATFYETCTNGTTRVTFKFKGAEASTFKMASVAIPADKVTYHLWADAYTTNQIVADTAMASANFAGFLATGVPAQLTVYGRVVGSENATAVVHADYADSVMITVSF